MEEARILNLLLIGERCESLETDIHADLLGNSGQAFGLTISGEASIPFARGAARDCTSLGSATHWSMQFNLDMTNLREEKLVMLDLAAIWNLGIGDAIIASGPFEPGEARIFAVLTPPDKGFEGQIDADSHVLQDLGMCNVQRGVLLFERCICSLLLKARDHLALMRISLPPLFK